MKTYTFTLTITESQDKPLSSSILEELENESLAKDKAKETNALIKNKRIEVLQTLLPLFRKEITEPLGLTCNIDRVSNWLHQDSIRISGDKLHSDNNIKIYVETPYVKDNYGNNICEFRDIKITFVKSVKDLGTYTYEYKGIEDFYTKMKSHLRMLHLKNK